MLNTKTLVKELRAIAMFFNNSKKSVLDMAANQLSNHNLIKPEELNSIEKLLEIHEIEYDKSFFDEIRRR